MSAAVEYPESCTIIVKPGKALEPEAEVPVLVSVRTPQGTVRTPSDICCVLDTSGSMGSEAKIMGASGTAESHGLSLLDVAKHGLRTIIKTCSSSDRLTIVTFHSTATTVLPLTVMDEAGQLEAEAQLESIQAGGGTQIWNGLFSGLEALRTGTDGRLAHVMLLTDGESQERDKIVPNLLQYKQTYERLPGTISTFGFGYNIDSSLLVRLASAGDGSYSFIPDAGFVGTVFVNTLSNLLVTMAREVYLSLEAEEGAEILGILGGYQMQDVASSGVRVNLGTLQYEQTKDVIVLMRVAGRQPYLVASASYEGIGGVAGTMPMAEGSLDADKMEVGINACRARYVDMVQQLAEGMQKGKLEDAQALVAAAGAFIEQSEVADSEQVVALLEDVKGQMTEAVSKADWYRKWGRHYAPSSMFAHKLQQCNNFKDPGVQGYGGPLFQDIRDVSDDIFNKLPVPKPSVRSQRSYAPPVSMAYYNYSGGGCIDGSCQVNLASGETRFICDLNLGDIVESPEGYSAEVLCLVRTPCRGGRANLVQLPGGVRLTPYHPVLHDGSWVFPVDLAEVSEHPCDSIYNLVLKGATAIVVGGVPCIALGHGIEDGAAKHPYFGQQQAIEDVAKLPGFEAGLVQLSPGWEVRDQVTGLICGIRSDATL